MGINTEDNGLGSIAKQKDPSEKFESNACDSEPIDLSVEAMGDNTSDEVYEVEPSETQPDTSERQSRSFVSKLRQKVKARRYWGYFVVFSIIIGFVSSVVGVGLFLSPILRPIFIYTDEQFQNDVKQIRDNFYIHEVSAGEIINLLDSTMNRRFLLELSFLKITLFLEQEKIDEARKLLNEISRKLEGSSGRKLYDFYSLAIDLVEANPKAPLWFALSVSKDTGSLYIGANISGKKATEWLQHVDNNWLIYPLLGRSHHPLYMLSLADTVIKETPDFAWGYLLRARSYFAALNDSMAAYNLRKNRRELREEILRNVEITLALAPTTPSAYYLRARVYEEMEDFDNSEFDYLRAIEFNPHYCEARLGLGVMYSKSDRPEDALKSAESTIKACPDMLQAYFNRAHALRKAGRIDEAISDFSFVVENGDDSERIRALNDRAGLYMSTRFWEKACDDYKAIMEYENMSHFLRVSTNNGLGVCMERRGELVEASRHYLKALSENPIKNFIGISMNLFDVMAKSSASFRQGEEITIAFESEVEKILEKIDEKLARNDAEDLATAKLLIWGSSLFVKNQKQLKQLMIEARKESGLELALVAIAVERFNEENVIDDSAFKGQLMNIKQEIFNIPSALEVYTSLKKRVDDPPS